MTLDLSTFIPINYLTLLSLIVLGGGVYFFFLGFRLLARKRLLLSTPTSKIRSAALGLVEVNGKAAGPFTMAAPITGKPCFLYHTTAWQQRNKKQDWEKVADETLHLPFFLDDSTGQLLIEPMGADFDLHRDFRQEYDASLFSSNGNDLSPRISAFLSRHRLVPAGPLRIEERSIKPDDMLFIAGTLMENPGVEVRPFSRRGDSDDAFRLSASQPNESAAETSAPQIIRLQSGPTPSNTQEMSQQEKIAAALTRAGITKPEAWSAAGVPYQAQAVEKTNLTTTTLADPDLHPFQAPPPDRIESGFDLTPPVVLMKGANDPTLVISFRSQKEFVITLGWKSTATIGGGAGLTLLGIYSLTAQLGWG